MISRSPVAVLVAALVTFAVPRVARSLPPPKTEAELLALADLVVDADATAIVCDGVPIVDPQKTTTKYVSTLFPSKSYKGGLPNSFQVRGYTEVWVGMPPTGGWHQEPIPKGWSGKLYLKKEVDGTYTKVWWNAMTEDTTKSKPQPLPSCGGTADGGPAKVDAGPAKVDGAPVKLDGAPAKVDGAPVTDGSSPKPDGALTQDGTPPRGDAAAAPVGDDGCSCGLARSGQAGSFALLLLALLALRRRR
jgi:hypothetical protein